MSRGSNACAAASASSRAARSARATLSPGRPTRPDPSSMKYSLGSMVRAAAESGGASSYARQRSFLSRMSSVPLCRRKSTRRMPRFSRACTRAPMRRDLPEILGRNVSSGSGSATALLGSAWSREKRRAFSADVSVRDGFFVTSGERSSGVRRQNDPKLRKPPRDDDSVADDASRVGFLNPAVPPTRAAAVRVASRSVMRAGATGRDSSSARRSASTRRCDGDASRPASARTRSTRRWPSGVGGAGSVGVDLRPFGPFERTRGDDSIGSIGSIGSSLASSKGSASGWSTSSLDAGPNASACCRSRCSLCSARRSRLRRREGGRTGGERSRRHGGGSGRVRESNAREGSGGTRGTGA